jgi:xylan 1,4-beta-xylosidase
VLRSRTITGPYEPNPANPILTQRDQPEDRPNPVTSVGHADYVVDNAGQWWATFLGVRPYEGDYYNTGRETFLLPVTWIDGWPVILEAGVELPRSGKAPALPPATAPALPTTGTFRVEEDFTGPDLPPHWLTPRVPSEDWYALAGGNLQLTPRPVSLGAIGQPSFLARRQQHLVARAEVTVDFTPAQTGDEAGLAAFQSETHWFSLGMTADDNGKTMLHLRQRGGESDPEDGVTVSTAELPEGTPVRLGFTADDDAYQAVWSTSDGNWQPIGPVLDGTLLSTRTAGGFVGAVFGVYAEAAK